MQIKLGEKIKELRKRDGRKQEELAVALGVTNQAVSRWEANGGYPDIEMLPAIANYFHITMDELFGYDNDRQTKLQSYMDQADQMYQQEDTLSVIGFLRNAISEFPAEWQLQYRLANSLVKLGYEKHKSDITASEGGDDIRNDTGKNAQNECWREAVSFYQEVLKKDIDTDSRTLTILTIFHLYSYMGEFENAKKIVLSQSPIQISREVLLANMEEDEKGDEYRGEAILSLLHELYRVIVSSIKTKHLQAGHDALFAITQLYESIFNDGNYGGFHNDMCVLYLECSSIAIDQNALERALDYFENALEHFMKFGQFMKSKPEGEIFRLTAPLVGNAKNFVKSIVMVDREWLEEHMKAFPAECADAIRKNPKYALIFGHE